MVVRLAINKGRDEALPRVAALVSLHRGELCVGIVADVDGYLPTSANLRTMLSADTPLFWVVALVASTTLGVGLYLMFPTGRFAGFVLTVLGIVGLLILIPEVRTFAADTLEGWYVNYGAPHPHISFLVVTILGAVFGALLFGGSWWLLSKHGDDFKRGTNPASAKSTSRPATLKELFENDWPDLPAYYTITVLGGARNDQNREIKLAWRLNGDFGARSKFLAFFWSLPCRPRMLSMFAFLSPTITNNL